MVPITGRLLFCTLLAASAFAQSPAFGPPSSFPAQKASLAIASGDFNGDGLPDVAVANSASATLSIFLGTGSGKFSPATSANLPSVCEAAYITAGNFTGAASPDLLAVCALGGVVVLPNGGAGTFGPPRSTLLPAPAWVGNLLLGSIHPAIADFNGDGHLDIAVPAFGDDILTASGGWYLLLGKGDGTFQPPTTLPFTGVLPLSLAAGEFNGDGKPDLVAVTVDSSGNAQLEFAAGNGDGTFVSPTTLSLPSTIGSLILPADINGDGKLDLVFAGSSLISNISVLLGSTSTLGASAVSVFLGDGKGGFEMSFNTTEAAYMSGAVLANILGTGKLDLIQTMIQENILSTNAPTGAIEIRQGNGDGTFGNPIALSFPSSTIPTDLAVADFNLDGNPDIAISSLPAAGITNFPVTTDLSSILSQVLAQFPSGDATVLLNSLPPVTPTITEGSVANGATYVAGGLVPGSWAQVKGTNLAVVSHYIWQASDFAGLGNNLPTSLKGTSVTVNGIPAAVYYVDPAQIDFQVPMGVSGTVSVQVSLNGVASNTVTVASSTSSPGIFPVIVNGVNYAGGVFTDGKYLGDPSVNSAFRNAVPGDHVQLFATGLTTAPAGVLVGLQSISGVSVTIGSINIPADFAGLVAAGEFQVNFTVPQQFANMFGGTYPITISLNGVSSPTTINSAPPGLLVIPIQP
jgi:uncharacterized protein (TIGR03437 family)